VWFQLLSGHPPRIITHSQANSFALRTAYLDRLGIEVAIGGRLLAEVVRLASRIASDSPSRLCSRNMNPPPRPLVDEG